MITMPYSNLEATLRTESMLDTCLDMGSKAFETTTKILKALDKKVDSRVKSQPTFHEAAEFGRVTDFRLLSL